MPSTPENSWRLSQSSALLTSVWLIYVRARLGVPRLSEATEAAESTEGPSAASQQPSGTAGRCRLGRSRRSEPRQRVLPTAATTGVSERVGR